MNKNENRVNITHNGQEVSALNLLPNLDSQEIAVVDYGVLKRLADLLPKADLWNIKSILKEQINDAETMPDLVKLLEEEITFHKSVNLISTIDRSDMETLHDDLTHDDFPHNIPVEKPRVVGKIDLDD